MQAVQHDRGQELGDVFKGFEIRRDFVCSVVFKRAIA